MWQFFQEFNVHMFIDCWGNKSYLPCSFKMQPDIMNDLVNLLVFFRQSSLYVSLEWHQTKVHVSEIWPKRNLAITVYHFHPTVHVPLIVEAKIANFPVNDLARLRFCLWLRLSKMVFSLLIWLAWILKSQSILLLVMYVNTFSIYPTKTPF